MHDHKYSLRDIEDQMFPWERQIYTDLLSMKIKEMEEVRK
jgi:hypothetical protein